MAESHNRMDERHEEGGRHRRVRPARRHLALGAAITALTLTGGACIAVAVSTQQQPPQPPAAAAPTTPAAPTTAALRLGVTPTARPEVTEPATLPHSDPVWLRVPTVDIRTPLIRLGLNPNRTVQVPPLEQKRSTAGWYDKSAAPGDLGPAVILGHVDSAEYGPAVFFRLGAIRPGARVLIGRADHTTATFVVDRTASYPKDAFPTKAIYGPTTGAALRLITCGGMFNSSTKGYESNIVVFAHLAG